MHKWLRVCLALFLTMALAAGATAASPLAPDQSRTVRVTVVGLHGTPVAGAAIQLLTPGAPAFSVIRTNQAGQAPLTVPDGFSFWLRVWANGYAVAEQPYVPASDGLAITIELTAYTASLVGLVTDDKGLPVEGAQVSVWLAELGLQAKATSDAHGAYQIDGLQARAGYSLQIEARGFQPFVQNDLTLGAGTRAQADAALTPARGTVTGEVVDSRTNQAIAGVKAELILNGWGVIARTATDRFGYFSFAAPPWNDNGYQVRLSGKEYETYTTAVFALAPGSWTDFSGGDRIALNPLYAELSGSVLDNDGAPLGIILVELQAQGLGKVDQAITDKDGYFAFDKIPAGTYRVRALPNSDHEHGASAWVTLNGGDRATADVAAPTPDSTSFGSSSLVGTVLDHLNNPVQGATVTAVRGLQTVTATTDARGRYRLSLSANIEDGLNPGTASGYHVVVEKEGFLKSDLQGMADDTAPPAFIDVRYKAANRADFTLQPAEAELAGRVLDDRGNPVTFAQVSLLQEGSGTVTSAVTNAAGHYRFTGLPVAKQARYVPVVVGARTFESSIAPDDTLITPTSLAPGAAVTHSLVAKSAVGTVQGVVRAGTDQPATGATVTVVRPADGKTWSATVRQDGTYSATVETGPGQQYLVRVTREGDLPGAATAAVDVAANEGVNANLAVVPLSAISGRVFQPGGSPAANAEVYLWAEGQGQTFATARTDASGVFRFDGLKPGRRYNVIVQGGVNSWSTLSPGEAILTPLVLPGAGETIWTDVLAPFATSMGWNRNVEVAA